MKRLMHPFSRLPHFPALAVACLLAAYAARADEAPATPPADWPDLPVTLAPSSLCTSNDAAVWWLWAAKQATTNVATPPEFGDDWSDRLSSISPFHVLHLAAPAPGAAGSAPPGDLRAVFEVFRFERNDLDLPPKHVPIPADYLPAPRRPLGEPLLVESRPLPGPLPCDIPIPPSVALAVLGGDWGKYYAVCLSLEARTGCAVRRFHLATLPLFENGSQSGIRDLVLASRDLSLESWKKLSSRKNTTIPFDALPPPDLLSAVPCLQLSSNAVEAILSDEGLPSLRRLLLAAVPIEIEGKTSRKRSDNGDPIDIPGVSRHSQFLRDHWQSTSSSGGLRTMLTLEDPRGTTNCPPALRATSPFAAVSVRWFTWSLAAFGAYLLATVLLLVFWFRRAPQERSGLWLAMPAAAVAMALLILLSGHLVLPRGARAVTRNLRIGCSTFPEEFCISATRLLLFRPAPVAFNYPSPAAIVRHGGLPAAPPEIFQCPVPELDATLVTLPPTTSGRLQDIEATWYASATCPLALHPQPAALAPYVPAGGNPLESNTWYAAACASRTIVPERDLDGLWVHIGARWYDLGPVRAGEPVAPRPDAWADLSINFPPYATFSNGDTCGCGEDGAPRFRFDYPPADAPWVTIALDTHTPPPAGPEDIPPGNEINQTLWITEWP